MKPVLLLLAATLLVPATLVVVAEPADACRPVSWICPLNGRWYSTCGNGIPPPLLQCTKDTLKGVELPSLP